MTIDDFWQAIAETRSIAGGDGILQVPTLTDRLAGLDLAEIREFECHLTRARWSVNSWDLIGAAWIIEGYVSDDAYEEFTMWLMMHGRETFETAKLNADSLADAELVFIDGHAQLEPAIYIARDAYDRVAGYDGAFYDDQDLIPDIGRVNLEPSGDPLPESVDGYARRWPRLWARYGNKVERLGQPRAQTDPGLLNKIHPG